MFNLSLLAMAGTNAGAQGAQGQWYTSLIPLAAIFAIFYFLLIRPQQKQQKKVREMLGSIKKGDKIITRGGMYGMVHGIADNILTIEISDNVRVKMSREAIAGVVPNGQASA